MAPSWYCSATPKASEENSSFENGATSMASASNRDELGP